MDDQFQLLFNKMKIEMQNQTESITNTIMDRMDEKLKPILEENRNLKIQIQKLENKIEYLERDKKSNNIIIYGLKEGEKSTTELINYTKQKFQEELDITLGDYDINRIYRIGKITNKGRPRPTLLSFTNGWKKSEIIKNKKKSKVLYIADDYSKETLEKRKALLPKLKEERNKGNIAYLKYDELIIKENSTANEKRKREPSASPYANSQPRKQQVTSFSPKKNRTNAFELMRGRSNSLTIHPSGKEQ